jgi:hypothetical protein
MIPTDAKFDLVHVGKCGGTPVARALRKAGYSFERVHMRRPKVSESRSYVLLVRDPVARFVSAFNWRRHVLGQDLNPEDPTRDPIWRLKHRAEWAFIAMFASAGELAEQLVVEPGSQVSPAIELANLIGHVRQGYGWYFDRLPDEILPSQLLAMVCQERLEEDLHAAFGIRPRESRHRDYPRLSEQLSPRARANLADILGDEYRTLEKLMRLADAAGIPMSVRYMP